jgi:di/tricarboxylate transporter
MSGNANHALPKGRKTRDLTLVAIGLTMRAPNMLMPTPAGLSLAGQRVVAVMVFTVFMWITEANPYGASAVALVFLLIVSLGGSPASAPG